MTDIPRFGVEKYLVATKIDGEFEIHIHHPTLKGMTLCGAPSEDSFDEKVEADLPSKPVATCYECLEIIETCKKLPRRYLPKKK